jgi:glycosyltransferase involved in cell wall biosynthesis
MNVLVASIQWPFLSGGAEVQVTGLINGLRAQGHRAEVVLLPFFPRPVVNVVTAIQVARAIEIGETNCGAIDRLITLKFPAYLIDHPCKTLWLIHQYRQLYDLWDEPGVGFAQSPFGDVVREAVFRADRLYLPHHRKLFAISQTVGRRLHDSCGLEADVLYPPLADGSGYFCDDADDYFVCPSRLSLLKRQDLVLRALALTRAPVRVRFIGAFDDAASLERFNRRVEASKIADRVEYLGWIGETEKRTLYARSIGIIFPPRLEDLGLVTQEAMLSSKPVVTCNDSGGVLEFVTDRENGLVTAACPEALAEALDRLWTDRPWAARMGRTGFERLRAMNLSWSTVVQRLLA